MNFVGKTLSLFGAAYRSDSWENFLTGFGTARDKTQAGRFYASGQISDLELANLYRHDDIAGRVVDVLPREMLRQGFGLACQNPVAAQEIKDRAQALDVVTQVRNAMIWGRLFGGALLLVGADDQQDPECPLDESKIRSLSFLTIYDKRRVNVKAWYENTKSPKFGEPKIYQVTNRRSGGIASVHESRVIRFGGALTDDEAKDMHNGWDYSVLQKPYEAIRQFSSIYKAAELLMTDASQGVLKIHGLINMIAGGQLKDLQTRALFLDQCRSIARSIMLDASNGESFEKQQTTFAGVGDMLDRSANRLAAAVELPVTILMGQAPAGLNATGASDIRTWYDRVQADREQILRVPLERLIRLIAISKQHGNEKFRVVFPPLWQETPKEKADREKVEADTAAVWINAEVLTPDEVAVARFGSAEPQPYRIDPKSRLVDPSLGPDDVPGAKDPP